MSEDMTYKIKLNKTTLALLLIAKKMKINPVALMLQYEQYKENVFYFFYMFADKFSDFLTIKELIKIIGDAKKYLIGERPTWLNELIIENTIILPLTEARIK